ncbi:MAG: TIGR02996 domain-containing protein [Gemmataceae bacterium]
MTDAGFLKAIDAAPNDDILRLMYADWLDEQGDRRGEFIRAEVEFMKADEDRREASIPNAQLIVIGRDIEPAWVAQISRVPIENCELEFEFQCPKKWDQLAPTRDAFVRHCEACDRLVHFCSDINVAVAHAQNGECVAVDPRLMREPGDVGDRPPLVLGSLAAVQRRHEEWEAARQQRRRRR